MIGWQTLLIMKLFTSKSLFIITPIPEEVGGSILSPHDDSPSSILHVTEHIHFLVPANRTHLQGHITPTPSLVVCITVYKCYNSYIIRWIVCFFVLNRNTQFYMGCDFQGHIHVNVFFNFK